MKVTIDQIKEALRKNGGFKTQAAKQLGISYDTLNHRIYRNKDLADICKEIQESYIDLAESKLIKMIKNEVPSAVFFMLKCQGKHRGYIENQRIEHMGKDEGPIQTQQQTKIDPSRLTTEELQNLISIIDKAQKQDRPTSS